MRDLEITRKLYEWVEDYFLSFKDFISEDDIKKKRYLTVSIAKFAYKAICKAMNWTEEYGTEFQSTEDEERIAGGYVAYPAGEEFHNIDCNLYVLDFSSLYPHIMIQANLYGRHKGDIIENRPIWNGKDFSKVEGSYYADEMSGISKLLKKWYFNRMFYRRVFMCVTDKKIYKMKDIEQFKGQEIYVIPKGSNEVKVAVVDEYWTKTFLELAQQGIDKREYSVKIIINTIYGILNTPYYKRVYDMIAGGDCTRLGRAWVKYARKVFRDNGYQVIYTDTDSCYILDTFRDKIKMLQIKNKIINDIKCTVPFPQDTFDMALEAEIKHIFFFKGGINNEKEDEMDEDDFVNKMKGLMKKNYIYVTIDDKLEIKNLGIRKKSNSPLSRKIFWEYLVPKIKEGQIKFSKTYLRQLIYDLLEQDLSLAAMRKEVGPLSMYEKSKTGIQAQISAKYGSGIHFLIPNIKNIGVGKGVSLCTMDEFKKHNLRLTDIELDNIWSELEYFTKKAVEVNIFSFGG